jgi:hypothetical protein
LLSAKAADAISTEKAGGFVGIFVDGDEWRLCELWTGRYRDIVIATGHGNHRITRTRKMASCDLKLAAGLNKETGKKN